MKARKYTEEQIIADSGLWPQNTILSNFPIWHQATEPRIDYGEPENFERVLADFPGLTLVLAHFVAAWWNERVELAHKYPNVYFDTASTLIQ
jgi:predicted TIM-barrel fold metal-dependent hydrolase